MSTTNSIFGSTVAEAVEVGWHGAVIDKVEGSPKRADLCCPPEVAGVKELFSSESTLNLFSNIWLTLVCLKDLLESFNGVRGETVSILLNKVISVSQKLRFL